MNDFKFFTNLNESFAINEGKEISQEKIEELKSKFNEELAKSYKEIERTIKLTIREEGLADSLFTRIFNQNNIAKNAFYNNGTIESPICSLSITRKMPHDDVIAVGNSLSSIPGRLNAYSKDHRIRLKYVSRYSEDRKGMLIIAVFKKSIFKK